MVRGSGEGRVEVIAGVMFSGKSEELLRRVRRALIARRKVQVYTSALDVRYGVPGAVTSHDGSRLEAVAVTDAREIERRTAADTDVVAIDEAQFMDPAIVRVVTALADRGKRVIVAGTDMNFRGEPFGPMPELLAVAERVDKLHAICVRCGESATRNQRLVDGRPAPATDPEVMVGGPESYEARCRRCHEVPGAGASAD